MMRAAAFLPLVAALLALPAPLRAEQATFFVIDAIKNDNGQIAIGTLVRQRAASPQVRDLGVTLVRDHTASKAEAIETGRTVGVGVPTEMTAQARHVLRRLASLSGPAFDAAFLTAAIKDYRKTIDRFSEQGRNGDPVTHAKPNKVRIVATSLASIESSELRAGWVLFVVVGDDQDDADDDS